MFLFLNPPSTRTFLVQRQSINFLKRFLNVFASNYLPLRRWRMESFSSAHIIRDERRQPRPCSSNFLVQMMTVYPLKKQGNKCGAIIDNRLKLKAGMQNDSPTLQEKMGFILPLAMFLTYAPIAFFLTSATFATTHDLPRARLDHQPLSKQSLIY